MRIPLAVTVALVLAGCAKTLWPALTATTPESLKQTLACAGKEAEARGYYLRSKRGDTWIEGRKDVENVPNRQYNEIRRYDILWMEAANQPEGTRLRIEARSFSERETRRGPTVSDEYATQQVKSDAQAILTQCGGAEQTEPTTS
jgi:hypothetical protein